MSLRKTAIVTGGTRGIGRAITLDLARDHNVLAVWQSTAPGDLPDNVQPIQADLTEPDAPQQVVDAALATFGSLDVIVNNAGIVAQSPKDDFDRAAQLGILDVNLLVPGALLAAALPHLGTGAAVVNISSVNAELPPRDASIYGASKAALNLWTKAMAKELGPQGIRVNAVAPGPVNIPEAPRPDDLTAYFVDHTALGRIGRPEDIAAAVRFLASDAAGFITGEILTVSGGYRL